MESLKRIAMQRLIWTIVLGKVEGEKNSRNAAKDVSLKVIK